MSMISISAYDLLNVIAEGEVTVQTLGLNLTSRGHTKRTADETILNCLIELCEAGLVACRSEHDYGNQTPKDKAISNAVELVKSWTNFYGVDSGPTDADENQTITVEITKIGQETVLSSSYDLYLPILKNQFGWPAG